jgi:hypothetical protein
VPETEDPYADPNQTVKVDFHYHADLNRLYFFSPIRRQMWLISGIVVADSGASTQVQDQRRARRGDIEFIVWLPALFETYMITPRSKFGEVCPPIPRLEAAARLGRSEAPPP